MNNISVIGIDIAKNVYELWGVNRAGKKVYGKRVRRAELLDTVCQLPRSVVVMESCGGSNYWARAIRELGHETKLIAPQFVKPYVKTNKTDRADAAAICEAAQRESMRFVPVKSIEQQDIQSIHRVRERLIRNRTALANELRGLLAEYGVVMPRGISWVRSRIHDVLEEHGISLSTSIKELCRDLHEEFRALDTRISSYDKKLKQVREGNEVCERLCTIPGVGTIVSTAAIASVGDPHGFKNGRAFAASLGVVPRQHSSGDRHRLGGISKRGDSYLRKQIIHGARSAVLSAGKKTDKRSLWIQSLRERVGFNKAVVAVANKNARTIWRLMTTDMVYQPNP